MADRYRTADEFRDALRRREAAAIIELERAYDRLETATRRELDRVLTDLDQARRDGTDPPVSWLYRRDRLAAIRAVIATEAARLATSAEGIIGTHRAATTVAGATEALTELEAALPARVAATLVPIDPRVVEQIAGQTSAGSPLRALLDELGPELSDRISGALVEGVSLGQSPIVIGRRLTAVLDGNRARAMTIARTEALRAHRQVSHLAYRANADVVRGWIWWSSLDRTACASCWAMHGSWHSLEEVLDEHPSGRCVPVPDVRPGSGQVEQALPDAGPAHFSRLPADAQRRILGPGKHDAYTTGDIDLADVVERRASPRWGTTRSESGLASALARHGQATADRPVFARPTQERMPAPSRDAAVRKLIDYALNTDHKAGRHKARVWNAALGYTSADAPILADQLIRAARSVAPDVSGRPEGWVRYRTVVTLTGRNGRQASVLAVWQSDAPGVALRLTTTYPN